MNKHVLKTGASAMYDTIFNGLVPCRVLSVRDARDMSEQRIRFELTKAGISARYRCDVEVTSTVGAYKQGEVLTNLFAHDVVPKSAVKMRGYSTVILAYTVEV